MRRFLPLLTAAAVAAGFSCAAIAAPVTHLSWDSCSGPLTRVLAPGETSATIFVTMSGIDVPHRGAMATFHLSGNDWRTCPPFSAAPYALPPADAWRFDPAGCQGSARASFDAAGSGASAGCPWISPAGAATLSIQDIRMFDDPEWGGLQVSVAMAYPTVPELAPDPNQTVFVFAVTFDLSNAAFGSPGDGRCGGLENFMLASNAMLYAFPSSEFCILGPVGRSEIVRTTGEIVNVDLDPSYLTIDASAVPAVQRTWGAIKSQYR